MYRNKICLQEIESSCLKFLTTQPVGWDFARAVAFFNANVSYSGLLHATTQVGKLRTDFVILFVI